MNKISFDELRKKSTSEWKQAVIVFSQKSFTKPFTETERSYTISSNANYFDSSKISNSLFGDCLDGKDLGVRLDYYIHGLDYKWIPEYCYITK